MKIVWRTKANESFQHFLSLLKSENPEIWKRWEVKINNSIGRLSNFPDSGKPLGFKNYREVIVPPFRVVYKVEIEKVVIVSFYHSRQHLN